VTSTGKQLRCPVVRRNGSIFEMEKFLLAQFGHASCMAVCSGRSKASLSGEPGCARRAYFIWFVFPPPPLLRNQLDLGRA